MFNHEDREDRLATIAEADAEYARNMGAQRPAQAWILSDRDVWYRNPAYSGPAVPHPEDYYDEEVAYEARALPWIERHWLDDNASA